MNKIRVLHISKRYPPYIGGIETVCHDICSTLRDDGRFEQVVLAFNDSPEDKDEIYDGVRVIRVGVQLTISSQPLAKNYGKITKRLFKEYKPQIVHFQYPNPFAAHYVLKYLIKDSKCKLLLQWNCDIIKQKFLLRFFDKQNKKLINRANMVSITTPTYLKDTSYLPFYQKDYRVLPCRIGDSRFIVTKGQIDKAGEIKKEYFGKSICFFFGRHVEYKGLKYLIDSDKFLDQDKIQILIGGHGPLTIELEERAQHFKNVKFLGKLSDDDLNSYLIACDVFTFPSITRNEAFGISLAEAMHFSKPTVTFTIKGSGVNWVSISGETGLEAENGNSKDFARCISEILGDKNLYSKLAVGAKARSDTLFSKEAFSNNVMNIYNGLVKGIDL